jgi:hypothetical protein
MHGPTLATPAVNVCEDQSGPGIDQQAEPAAARAPGVGVATVDVDALRCLGGVGRGDAATPPTLTAKAQRRPAPRAATSTIEREVITSKQTSTLPVHDGVDPLFADEKRGELFKLERRDGQAPRRLGE